MTRQRAESSGIRLTKQDAALVKGMLVRGDRQHDIAAWFGVNGGRIAEIATGAKHGSVSAAGLAALPPPGPYPSVRAATVAVEALAAAKDAIAAAEGVIRQYSR